MAHVSLPVYNLASSYNCQALVSFQSLIVRPFYITHPEHWIFHFLPIDYALAYDRNLQSDFWIFLVPQLNCDQRLIWNFLFITIGQQFFYFLIYIKDTIMGLSSLNFPPFSIEILRPYYFFGFLNLLCTISIVLFRIDIFQLLFDNNPLFLIKLLSFWRYYHLNYWILVSIFLMLFSKILDHE